MKKTIATRGCFHRFAAFDNVAEIDALSVDDLATAFDPDREDPLLTPWRRSYHAAIRRALGH